MDLGECRRCGQCSICGLLQLCEKHGVRSALAGGGQQAVSIAADSTIKAVIAVACEKELVAGIIAVWPKPVFGVINLRPNGPCKDCSVDLNRVEEAICNIIISP